MNQGAAVKRNGSHVRQGAAAPAVPVAHGVRSPRSQEDPYDALTELFLGEVHETTAPGVARTTDAPPVPVVDAPAPATPARDAVAPAEQPSGCTGLLVEGLILGHLPVLAPAWAAQYVRRAAEVDAAPVGFARMQSTGVTIEILGLDPARRAELRGPAPAVEAALELAAAVVRRWIVRVDEFDEPGLMRAAGVDVITLLTSADEAAIVAAYRTLKRLALADQPEDLPRCKRLRIAIMGAAPERAKAVADRLSGAAAAFLGRSIEVGEGMERIESGVPSAMLFRGKASQDAPALLDLIRRAPVARVPSAPREAGVPARAPVPAAPVAEPSPTKPAFELEIPIPDPAPSANSPLQTEQSLSRLVPSLTALAARCPFAREVDLAVDATGRAHLLVRAAAGGHDAAVRSALIAAAWLAEHAELVGLIAPRGLRLDGARPPVRHVFIQHARDASAMLRTGMRVHLLARAEAGRETSVELE
jgi:hypothetical protein